MNRVLSKFFNLPPHVRMMLALAGFGSMASIIFFMLPALRSRSAKYWIIGVLVVALVLFGIIYLIRRMFGKKKAAALDSALESQGPTRGDIAEQEQIYKEKFKSKLAELKANGLSVYKLPWFVLMGEPGSGKTATLINSGLDFPLGKDEVPGFGGTRNYNWWFTNNAVILDTAGRIAFQEEGTTDKVEWEYFIKMLKVNRPRCPINGVIVAIPADKLLRDNSEEREQKATILRERLRQVHQLLGVRFPTFVIVTKMDLVGGFNEFFDEIRPDLQQRNQMFGWSRPDEFQTPYEPATFLETFDEVYQRLRDWAMRYLQRTHATDQELGLVVTFPESFRQIRTALNDYVSTIFQKSPLLEPPFFRGFYFTSSVQEGAPIFDVFAKSRGGAAPEPLTTKTVDSKAFFIHDFYEKKVFPEQGLVFRSAKHVTLNKRMRRMVMLGSSAMAVLMLTFFVIGAINFRKLLKLPEEDCASAAQYIGAEGAVAAPTFANLPGNVQLAQRLSGHITQYQGAWKALSARMMFPFANMSVPKGFVEQIHSKFVLMTILDPTLKEFAARVNAGRLPELDQRELYLKALENFAIWYGETVGQGTWTQEMTPATAATRAKQFEAILACLSGDVGAAEKLAAVEQVQLAFEYLAPNRAFAQDVLKPHAATVMSRQTMDKAVEGIRGFYERFTNVDSSAAAGAQVGYWIGLFEKVGTVQKSYESLLGLRVGFDDGSPETAARFLRETADIKNIDDEENGPEAEDGTFCQSWYSLAQYLKDEHQSLPRENGRILRLRDLFNRRKLLWVGDFARLERALDIGADRAQEPVFNTITDAKNSLDKAFADSWARLLSKVGFTGEGDPLEYYVNQRLLLLTEAQPGETVAASIKLDNGAFGKTKWLTKVLDDLRGLAGDPESLQESIKDLSQWKKLINDIDIVEPDKLDSEILRPWFKAVRGKTDLSRVERQTLISGKARFHAGQNFWQPVALYDLSESIWNARRTAHTGQTLKLMIAALKATHDEQPSGIARLVTGFDSDDKGLPFDSHRFNQKIRAAAPRPAAPGPDQQKQRPAGRVRRGGRGAAQPDDSDQPARRDRGSAKLLSRYHTRKFLYDTLRLYKDVEQSIPQEALWKDLRTALSGAADKYAHSYFKDWHGIYSDYTRLLDLDTLGFIEQCQSGNLDWPAFRTWMDDNGDKMSEALGDRMKALIREAVIYDDGFGGDETDDSIRDLIERQLDLLNSDSVSIVDILKDVRGYPEDARRPEADLANKVEAAMRIYLVDVRKLGNDENRRGAVKKPPDVTALRDQIVDLRYLKPGFPIAAPLLALADYGEDLLTHHLETKLAEIIRPKHDHYPLLKRDDIPDPNEDAVKLKERIDAAIPPVEFLKLLREVARFRKDYGTLYEIKGSKAGNATLDKFVEWEQFLYGDEGVPDEETPRTPDRMPVNVAIKDNDFPRNTRNIGSVCTNVCMTLPLFDGRDPAGEICINPTVSAPAAPGDSRYFWRLQTNNEFKMATVWMKDVNANSTWNAGVPAWTLPASPWALPLLLRSQKSDVDGALRVQIPVVFRQAGQAINLGVFIVIKFEREFPGPIPQLRDIAPVSAMAGASTFLSSAGG